MTAGTNKVTGLKSTFHKSYSFLILKRFIKGLKSNVKSKLAPGEQKSYHNEK